MANLPETSEFPDGIYQIEQTDPVVGGLPNLGGGQGMTNVPIQQLAQRTRFLKDAIDSLPNDLRGGVAAALDTLAKLAAAINDDPAFAATVTALIAAKAPLASPAFTGHPTAPTQVTGNESTRLATTAYVAAKVAAGIDALVSGAPGAMNTLNELAEALGDDPDFATTIASQIGGKLAKTSNLSDLDDAAEAVANLGLDGLNARFAAQTTAIWADIDTAVETGVYRVSSASTAHAPDLGVAYDATLFVQAVGGQVTQWLQARPGEILTRIDEAGSWESWEYLAFQSDLDAKADKVSPAFTGSPTAPTQAAGNNSTRLATTAFVGTAVGNLNSSMPGIGQTWQDMTGSRVSATSYQNSTNRPITVVARAGGDLLVSTNNSAWVKVGESGSEFASMTAIVPPGHYYQITGSITYIAELR